jgi:outer membrane autotransporter protein
MRVRDWLAGAVAAMLLTPVASAQFVLTGTRTLNAADGTSYTVAADAYITGAGMTIRDVDGETVSWLIANSGTINATGNSSIGINLYTTGSSMVTNEAGGYIKGVGTTTNYAGVKFGKGWGSLTNRGYIEGYGNGVLFIVGGSLGNSGTIKANSNAVRNNGGGFAVQNSGYIEGGASGMYLVSGARIENSGSIRGLGAERYGIWVASNAGAEATLLNQAGGYVEGGASGVFFEYTGTVTNYGAITGLATSGTAAGILSDATTIVVRNQADASIAGRSGVYFNGGTVENSGTIIGRNTEGVYYTGTVAGAIVNNAGGRIVASSHGVRLTTGGTAELRNTGGALIRSEGSGNGVQTGASLLLLNDASTIESNAGLGVNLSGGGGSGTVANVNGASIIGSTSGLYSGVFVSVTNGAGSLIQGNGQTTGQAGVYITNNGRVEITNSGTIIGGMKALHLGTGDAHVVVNTGGGVISGTLEYGPSGGATGGAMSGGITQTGHATNVRTVIIENAGLVSGGNHGIYLGNGGLITNTGTIRAIGTQIAAVYFAAINASTSTLRLGTGSVLDGDVLSAKATGNKVILEGTGVEDANFTGDGLGAGAGFESLAMNGADWTLGGSITLTGSALDTIAVNSGTLVLNGTLAMLNGGGATIAAGGQLAFGFGDAVFSGTIHGDGGFAYLGSGSLGLGDGNTYTGDTLVKSGTLTGKIGAGALRLEEGTATYIVDPAAAVVSFANVSGAGVLNIQNADIAFGVGAGETQTYNFAGTIDTAGGGANKLVKTGEGKLVLEKSLAALGGGSFVENGILSLSDVAYINSGTLVLGSAAGMGLIEYTGAGNWTTNVTLAGMGGGFQVAAAVGTGTQTLGAISVGGTGVFAKSGDGALDITDAAFGAGVSGLQVRDGTLIGGVDALKGDIELTAATSTLVVNHGGAGHEYADVISGSGNLIKEGGGLLELTGDNTYEGTTTIKEGTLQGKVGTGTLRVESSGTYKVADGVNDFIVVGIEGEGTVNLNQSSLILDMAAGVTGSFSFSGQLMSDNAASKLVKKGEGTTMLLSRVDLNGGTEIQEGVLWLDDQNNIGGGILLGTGSTSGLIAYANSGSAWTKTITLGGAGGFSVDGSVGSGTLALAITVGGTGTFMKDGSGALDIKNATLGEFVKNVTVLNGTLIGDADSFKGDIALTETASTLVFYHDAAAGHLFSGLISGNGSLVKDGGGLVNLTGGNTYAGDTTIRSGTLQGNIGQGTLTVDAPATYKVADGVSLFTVTGIEGAGTVHLNEASLVLNADVGMTGTFSFGGQLAGSSTSALIKTGAGTTELQSVVRLQGGALIKEGTLRLENQDYIQAPVVLGTSTTSGLLEYTGTGSPWAHEITLATGGGGGFAVNRAGAGTLALTNVFAINGAGNFVKGGDGMLDITAANITNTAEGKTVVLGGRLRGDATKFKAAGIELSSADSEIEFYQTVDGGYASQITGAGALLKTGDALLDLGATDHTYGNTIIRGGVLTGNTGTGTLTVETSGTYRVGADKTEFSVAGVLGDGTIDMAGADMVLRVDSGTTPYDFAGRLIGGGRFIKTGAGTVELLGAVALDEGAIIREGAVRLGDQGFLRAPVVLGDEPSTGMIHYTGTDAWALSVRTQGQGGGFRVEGGATVTFAVGATITTSAAGAPFIKDGVGTLDITAATTTGPGESRVLAGTLRGSAASMPASGVTVSSGATVEFFEMADAGYAGVISGSGALYKTGAGTLALTTAPANTMDVTIAGGNLKTAGIVLPSLTIHSGAGFETSGSQTITSLVNDGTIYLNASVNAHNGVIEKTDKLAIANASGGGSIRVRLNESTARRGATSAVLMVTGTDPSVPLPYSDVALDGRAVHGAFDWTARALDNTVVLAVGELSPEVGAAGGLDASSYLAGKASFAAISRRLLAGRTASQKDEFQVWAGGMRREDTLTADLYEGAEARTNVTQIGADWNFGKMSARPLTLGVYYDYADSNMEMPAGASKSRTTSYGIGVYGSYRTKPLYVDVILRGAREDFEVDVPYAARFTTKGTSMAASIELGGALPGTSVWNVEPQARITYQRHEIDGTTDGFGREISVDSTDSIEGRLGVRVWREFVAAKREVVCTPYLRGSLAHEANGKGTVTMLGGGMGPDAVFNNKFDGSVGIIDGGFGLEWKRGFRLQVEGAWYYGDKLEGFSGSFGVAFTW